MIKCCFLLCFLILFSASLDGEENIFFATWNTLFSVNNNLSYKQTVGVAIVHLFYIISSTMVRWWEVEALYNLLGVIQNTPRANWVHTLGKHVSIEVKHFCSDEIWCWTPWGETTETEHCVIQAWKHQLHAQNIFVWLPHRVDYEMWLVMFYD